MRFVAELRGLVGRSTRITMPVATFCGIIADLASTVARFSYYLLVASLALALVSGLLWFNKYRRELQQATADGIIQPEELAQLRERNIWSVLFAFSIVASLVMGGFVVAEKVSGHED